MSTVQHASSGVSRSTRSPGIASGTISKARTDLISLPSPQILADLSLGSAIMVGPALFAKRQRLRNAFREMAPAACLR